MRAQDDHSHLRVERLSLPDSLALADAGFRDVRRHASLGVFSAYTAIKPEHTVEAS